MRHIQSLVVFCWLAANISAHQREKPNVSRGSRTAPRPAPRPADITRCADGCRKGVDGVLPPATSRIGGVRLDARSHPVVWGPCSAPELQRTPTIRDDVDSLSSSRGWAACVAAQPRRARIQPTPGLAPMAVRALQPRTGPARPLEAPERTRGRPQSWGPAWGSATARPCTPPSLADCARTF